MRDVITKNVTEEDIIESADRVFGRGFQRMKLYFMIGLPTEEDDDVRGIVETAARVKEIGRRYFSERRGDRLGLDPRAQAAHAVPVGGDGQRGGDRAQAGAAGRGGARDAAGRPEDARELPVAPRGHLLARRSARCGDLLERGLPARLPLRRLGRGPARRSCGIRRIAEERRRTGFEPQRYLGTIPVTARLPWDHIDIGLEPDFLVKEYRKALKDRLSPPCGKPYKQLLHPSSVAGRRGGRGQEADLLRLRRRL